MLQPTGSILPSAQAPRWRILCRLRREVHHGEISTPPPPHPRLFGNEKKPTGMDSCHRSLRRPTVADPPRDRSRSAGHENRRSLSAVRFYRLPIANRELRYAADGGARRTLDRRWNRNEVRSDEHTSELQSLMRISYAVFCL